MSSKKRSIVDISPITLRTRDHRMREQVQNEIDDFLQTCLLLSQQPTAIASGSWEMPTQCTEWIIKNNKDIVIDTEEKTKDEEDKIVQKKQIRGQVFDNIEFCFTSINLFVCS